MSCAAVLSLAAAAHAADTPLPEPLAPQHATLEDGRIDVYIGTPRASDYQIGDSIPVKVVFILTPNSQIKLTQKAPPLVVPGLAAAAAPASSPESAAVPVAKIEEPKILDMPMVQVEGLKMGVVSDKPSDVELLAAGAPETYIRPDGSEMVVEDFYVTTYVTTQQTQVGVSIDFMYAVYSQPDGQPDWKSTSTPELPIGITKAATDNQVQIQNGDMSDKVSPRAPAALWILLGSLPFALPMVAACGLLIYRRVTRARVLSRNEKTWVVLDAIVASAHGRLEMQHYRRIFYAIREHLGVLGMDTTQTLAALGLRPELDKQAVDEVFNQETLFFDPSRSVEAEEHESLLAAIALLIPRQ
jgi:hypothetical protein